MRINRAFVSLWLVWLVCLLFSSESHAAPNEWAEGSVGKNDGATRDYYNRGASLRWKNKLGDWMDVKGKSQGEQAYAIATIIDNDQSKPVTWNVTSLVQAWRKGKYTNHGFFLRLVKGSGPLIFASREDSQKIRRPKLILNTSNGPKTLEASADTYLSNSTYRSLGNRDTLRIGHVLIRFSFVGLKPSTTILKATLQLTTTKQYGGTNTVGVFRCQQGEPIRTTPPQAGISAQFTNDVGIEKHPSVLFADRFEATNWKSNWTKVSGSFGTTISDSARKFTPFFGRALWTKIAKGKLHALSAIYGFKKKLGTEPEAIYFRYYLRLGDDWNQTVQGGKMPGIVGTYDKAGWGGRRSNGSNGWSARGAFAHTIPKGGNPLGGYTPIGSYVYHANQPTTYGEVWIWTKGYGGFIPNNRWTCVEQYVKLNTPGKKDGILRAWINGRLAFEKKDIRYRTVSKLKIQRIWMNVYHGGKTASPYDQHMYIDNVVIARQYIGPVSSRLGKPFPSDGSISSDGSTTSEPLLPDGPTQDLPQSQSDTSGSSEPFAELSSSFEARSDVVVGVDKPVPSEYSAPLDTSVPPETSKNSGDFSVVPDTGHQNSSGCGCSSTSSPMIIFLLLLLLIGYTHRFTSTQSPLR